MPHPALVFAIAFGATLVASMSGGSASLVTTPAWLFLGVPLPVAIASDKVAGAFWTLPAARAGQRVVRVLFLLTGAVFGLRLLLGG